MIRNETEYKAAVARLQDHEARLVEQEANLKAEGLKPAQIKRGMDPLVSFTEQLREEVGYYEHLKQGNIPKLEGFNTIGHALIALRIAKNVSQADLANRLGVDPSQISRDERNEYHGITIERADRVMDALEGSVRMQIYTTASRPSPEKRRSRDRVPA